jgi:hypothetical protein
MATDEKSEFWLSGPVADIAPVLQPAAHAILQACREVQESLENFQEVFLWQRPGGVASVAFHLQHLAGVLDRLFTYARGEQLSALQLDALQKEIKEDKSIRLGDLLQRFNKQVETAIEQLKNTRKNPFLK